MSAGNVLTNIFDFFTGGKIRKIKQCIAALEAAEKRDLDAVRAYFSLPHVKKDLAGHPFNRTDPGYMEFLTIAARTDHLALAQFVLEQGVRPMTYIVDDLKKEGINNAVTALLEKNIVVLFPKKDRNIPKP